MDDIARLDPGDRTDLFRAAAEVKGVRLQIVEKDFWICWMLKHLFTLEQPTPRLWFKGGTSLSKVYSVLERMSEDIDLVIDRTDLGFTAGSDPGAPAITGKERRRRIEELKRRAAVCVADALATAVRERLREVLGDTRSWRLETDVSIVDNPRLLFHYPNRQTDHTYLKPLIMLEFGARGSIAPSVTGSVMPYVAELLPQHCEHPRATVRAISAERTFLEKVTILHALAHRGIARSRPFRQSRHFYDVYRLWKSGFGRRAAEDGALLTDVVEHKCIFYRDPRAHYDLALRGGLRLVPPSDVMGALRSDYREMCEVMVFGDPPGLAEVVDVLREIERHVNGRNAANGS